MMLMYKHACRSLQFPCLSQREGNAAANTVQFADVGCGFGGLLIRLSTAYPETLMVGLEIRDKVRFGVNVACILLKACRVLSCYTWSKVFMASPHCDKCNKSQAVIVTSLTGTVSSHGRLEHVQVTSFVRDRIAALRREHPGEYGNICAIRTNSQKYLVNYFAKGQLTKLFLLFPVSPSHPKTCAGPWSELHSINHT